MSATTERARGATVDFEHVTKQYDTRAKGTPGAVNDLAVLHMSKPGGAAKAREVLAPALVAHPEDAGLNLNMALALADTEKGRAREYARKAQTSPDKRIREQAEKLLASLA